MAANEVLPHGSRLQSQKEESNLEMKTASSGRKRKLQSEKGTNGVVLTHAAHGNDVAGSVSDGDRKKRR